MIISQEKKSVAVIIWFNGKIMLSQRKGKNFKGKWAVVGGKVEKNEYILRAAQREILEECGLFFLNTEIFLLDSYVDNQWKCFIFEAFRPNYLFMDVKNNEPKKHSAWTLFSISDALKLDLMPALREYLEGKLLTINQESSKI